MKKDYIFLLVFILLVSGCKHKPAPIQDPLMAEAPADVTEVAQPDLLLEHDTIKMADLYERMTNVDLPFNFDQEFITHDTGFLHIPQNMYRLFYNSEQFDKDARIAKLPQKGNFHPVLVYYHDKQGEAVMDIYTLSDSMKVIDRLQIYSIEKPEEKPYIISQAYAITDDFKFKVYKRLNGTMIEQLTYIIDNKGCFEEVRDGQTPTIAFESADNVKYMVESFIWDHNQNGGLIRKNLKRKFYSVNDEGKVTEVY